MACVRLYTIYTYILLTLGDIEREREGEREREREREKERERERDASISHFHLFQIFGIFNIKVLNLIEIFTQIHVDNFFIENQQFAPIHILFSN